MKKFTILLFAVITCNAVCAQSCLPGGITFYKQAQIDSFQIKYPGCTKIEGDVTIEGSGGSITNLKGLSSLVSIGGELTISSYDLTSLTGLDNLISIGGGLMISVISCPNLNGLDNLISIGGGLTIQYISCPNLTGLDSLNSIGGDLYIGWNENLTSLKGLDNLNSIGGDLSINSNGLSSLKGLDNLNSIGGNLLIESTTSLTSLNELNNLNSIGGDLFIGWNQNLTSLTGLENLDAGSITDLTIRDNPSLSTCHVQSICNFLANPTGTVIIIGNAEGCNNPPEVASNCGIKLSCLPYGNYIFQTQSDIDNFQINYSNCIELEGNVTIRGSDISNLNGLSALTSIGGSLQIQGNSLLTNLTGLDNLISLGGNLEIFDNRYLASLTALDNLISIRGDLLIGGAFYDGDMWWSVGNPSLTSLKGLDNLAKVEGKLQIVYNDVLTSITELDNLISLGGSLDIINNISLTSLTGLDNLISIGGRLEIYQNDKLISFKGLDKLGSIGGNLEIFDNRSLTSVTELDNLISLGGSLMLFDNISLTSLTGLDNLISIGGGIEIYRNDKLTSLTGLDNISPRSIESLSINYNKMLSTCAVKSICDYLASPNGTVDINDNATGCNNQSEVKAACLGVGLESISSDNIYNFYPNPATNKISIVTNSNLQGETMICIFNMNGVLLQQEKFQSQNLIELDVSNLAKGIYMIKIQTNKEIETKKLVVQ